MRLSKNSGNNIGHAYRSQSEDFMKYWLRVDGPYKIIERVMGDQAGKYLDGVVHMCQACAILHKTPEIREKIYESYSGHLEEVMTRFALNDAVEHIKFETEEIGRASGGERGCKNGSI